VRAVLLHRQAYASRPRQMKVTALKDEEVLAAALADVAPDGTLATR
jgi:hypothetical protein